MTLLFMMILAPTVKAETLDMGGGVKNHTDYQEVVFISGEPVLFVAPQKTPVKITESIKGNKLVRQIKLSLVSIDNDKDKLTRDITYESEIITYDEIGQQTANEKITKFKETATIAGVKYDLVTNGFEHSDAKFVDVRPASDYYSGRGITRKIYNKTVKRNQPPERVIVNVETRRAGYENFWGATEALLTDTTYELEVGGDITDQWIVANKHSVSKSRVLEKQENLSPNVSYESFYVVESYREMGSIYEYELADGETGEIELNLSYTPNNVSLPVAKFSDMKSIAEHDRETVSKMFGLQVINGYPNNTTHQMEFRPGKPISRLDFTVGLAELVDLRVNMPDERNKNKNKNKGSGSYFNDIPASHPKYDKLLLAAKKGLTTGNGRCNFNQPPIIPQKPSKNNPGGTINPCAFSPDASLTRAQAATFLVRAVGMQNKEANMNVTRAYHDVPDTSSHANNIYLARELGLMNGFLDSNTFKPNQYLTRMQAMRMLENLLNYLEDDLKQLYLDDIIFTE